MRNLPNLINATLIISLAVLLHGCNSGGTPTALTSPSLHPSGQSTTNPGARHILGFWEIEISADHSSATAVPLRGAEMHFNMVHILETTCANCLTLNNFIQLPDDTASVGLTIKHPFPGLAKFTGFDVRGILMTVGDYTFPVSGRRIAWGDQNLRLLNPDGYTTLFNPTDFPEYQQVPFILRYTKGKFASDTADLTSTLNPFLAYSEDQPRRIFLAGTSQTQTAILRLPNGPIRFGYAVDASWFPPDGDVIDPITDFPPEANSLEAYKINVNSDLELGPYAGSSVPIEVEIWDHQGPETISTVTIESPDLFNGEVALTYLTTTPENSAIFTGTLVNELGTTQGEHPLLVRVADSQMDPNIGAVDAWNVRSVNIEWQRWTRTWGASGSDFGYGVAADGSGNTYVTGWFRGNTDFDPGPGEDNHASNGSEDVFLSRFDSSGNFIWAETWGGGNQDWSSGVAVDGSGNVYVTGIFKGTADFNPGTDVDNHTSNGEWDACLSMFDSSGNFQWARTWGGSSWDGALGVTLDGSGNVYATGYFTGTVDFDPGPGIENHISNAGDVFLSIFDSSGNFQWARTWGGSGWDNGHGVAVDSLGNVYVTGSYEETVDFDPGPDEDYHNSNGWGDIFLSSFGSSGNFLWAITWGGSSWDEGNGVGVDNLGNLYVTGRFWETVDFDPGPSIDNHTPMGYGDIFLSRFNSLGNFQWANTWGSIWYDNSEGVAVDGSGEVYVTGCFSETVDFDPSSDIDNHTSIGERDVFLSKFVPE